MSRRGTNPNAPAVVAANRGLVGPIAQTGRDLLNGVSTAAGLGTDSLQLVANGLDIKIREQAVDHVDRSLGLIVIKHDMLYARETQYVQIGMDLMEFLGDPEDRAILQMIRNNAATPAK